MTLGITISSFPLIFLGHLLYERVWIKKYRPRSRQKLVMIIGILISLVCALLAFAYEGWLDGVYVFIVSMGFAHVYFHIFNMSETARRIRILTSAFVAQKEGIPWEMPKEYTPEKMIEERIERLLEMRAIELKEGKIVSRSHPLLIAALAIEKYRQFFPSQRSGARISGHGPS